MASRKHKPAGTMDRGRTAEADFGMLYSRVNRYKAQLENPAPPEYIVDGIIKPGYTRIYQAHQNLCE